MKRILIIAVGLMIGSALAQEVAAVVSRPSATAPGQSYVRPAALVEAKNEARGSEGDSCVGVSLFDEVSAPSADFDIRGFRLNVLMGTHEDVSGLDIGLLANTIVKDLKGISIAGGWTNVGRSLGSLTVAGCFNYVEEDSQGVQLALGYNSVFRKMKGAQVAAVNDSVEMNGLQLGVVNVTDRSRGLQVGIVNYAVALDGMQVGLVNIIETSEVPCLPVLNFAF